jgi:hypothetical protein
MLGAYFYMFAYLSLTFLRRPIWLELYIYRIGVNSSFFKKAKVSLV